MRVTIDVDPDEVLDDLSDNDIVAECERRQLSVADPVDTKLGPALDDVWQIERALDRKDWPEVEYLIRKALAALRSGRRT